MADNRSRSYLAKLPPELLYLIVGQFCEHCRLADTNHIPSGELMEESQYWKDKQDLRSLCLVSKAIGIPAQSVLHHLCVGGFKWDYSHAYRFRYTPLFRFIGSVANAPHLRGSVRAFSLGHGYHKSMRKVWAKSLATPESHSLRKFMSSAVDGAVPLKVNKINFIAKLITTFPLLTDLSIGEMAADSPDYVPENLDKIQELSLQNIDLCARTFGRRWGISKLIGEILGLSRGLRTLKIDSCTTTEIFVRPLKPPLSLSRLQHLDFANAWLDEDDLQQIFGIFPSLHKLSYHATEIGQRSAQYCHRRHKRPPSPFGVIRALEPSRNTLTSLDLELYRDEDDVAYMRPADFSTFTALQNLKLPWYAICPIGGQESTDKPLATNDEFVEESQLLVGSLPSGIRTLSIIDCKRETHPERLESALEGLAAAKVHEQFPHLQRVACDADALMDSRNFTRTGTPIPTTTPETNGGQRHYVFDREKRVRTALLAAGVQAVDYDLATRAGVGLREELGVFLRN